MNEGQKKKENPEIKTRANRQKKEKKKLPPAYSTILK